MQPVDHRDAEALFKNSFLSSNWRWLPSLKMNRNKRSREYLTTLLVELLPQRGESSLVASTEKAA